jgi:ATP-binding cassette subfamily B protein
LREQGAHQELLAQRGIYYRLYQLQYKEQELHLPQDADSSAAFPSFPAPLPATD